MEKKKEKEKNKELEEREEEIVDWEQRLASQWSNVYIKRRELRGRERELLQREIAVSQRNEASIRLSAESRRVCEEATRAMKTISEWEEAPTVANAAIHDIVLGLKTTPGVMH
ncbi:hypothetical protein A7C99_2223 [Trichophyton rubrum]|uniref:Uncharacterized protein n=4 Tax=Trichophyton TaxID=5550 RepID=A0A178F3F8_TRIRU|nr:uncharacterized protein TERG_04468 [Trichophyton rubrum CBS 118892]EGD88218.2 hypothetical protein TERG_04468 [Trichophyton rubrum CBS 118892]EZG06066.1 hypothetical protein H106_04523 [Trichophyton rubrum CBS 735.88]OAL66829.1 hypothetical protein A7C99_2223 [Trichophyton rubrum]